jgi:hypothetical protein
VSDNTILKTYEEGGYRPRLSAASPGWSDQSRLPSLLVQRLESSAITDIPPRQWAYGHFLMFGSASVLGAVDGIGKGAIAVVKALAMITGKPLLGERVWRSGRVAIVSYEDDATEWRRRIAAACIQYELDYDEMLENFRFIYRPNDRVAFGRLTESGTVEFPDSEDIIAELNAMGAVLMIVDPFNQAQDLTDGNNNVMVAKVANELSRIARECGIAVLVLHHVRKGAHGDLDDLMGATSLRATFRNCRILVRMTDDEATQMNISESWRYCRVSSSKQNYAPPPGRADWFKLNSVPLCNPTESYPDGDNVGVATIWQPRPMFEGMDNAALTKVFAELRRTVHSPHKQAKNTPWAGNVLMKIGGRSVDEARKIIKAWLASGVLTSGEIYDPKSKHEVQCVTLDEVKAAEILVQLGVFNAPPD